MKVIYNKEINDYVYQGNPMEWVVTDVRPQSDYSMIITFINGEKRIYDAAPLLNKPIYAPLKNLHFFLQAKVEGDTVVWSDEIDIAPEHLYECSKTVK